MVRQPPQPRLSSTPAADSPPVCWSIFALRQTAELSIISAPGCIHTAVSAVVDLNGLVVSRIEWPNPGVEPGEFCHQAYTMLCICFVNLENT